MYQRNDLIDPNRKTKEGFTNLQLMKTGKAPWGPDNKKINVHHLLQTQNGAIAEVSGGFHQKYKKILHINPSSTPSGIDRKAFDKWRESYWKMRAKDFE